MPGGRKLLPRPDTQNLLCLMDGLFCSRYTESPVPPEVFYREQGGRNCLGSSFLPVPLQEFHVSI